MKFENWISYRYLIASKGRFLTFLNVISILGVAIGVMALILVMGIMTGFGNNLREKIIGTTPHIMIEKETGVKDFNELRARLLSLENVEGVAPYVQSSVFLESSGQALGLVVRGVDPALEGEVTKVREYLTKGNLDHLEDNKVFIGRELARYFGYRLGDEIVVISPGSGISGEGWRYTLVIGGIFNTGMVDYDMNLILVNIKQAQRIITVDENVSTGIGVKISNPNDAKIIKEQIYQMIGFGYVVKTWIDINRNLFEALFLEKWGLFIILVLMILVASFNIVSTLVVTVASKIQDIGVLQSIGVSKKSIRRIFTRHGLFIGGLGTTLGVLSGLGLSYILRTYVKVPQEIYSIDRVPIDIQTNDLIAIIVSAVVISFLATIYPSSKAAKLEPVEALRYQ